MKIEDRCRECKKDWTKCGTCPVSMKWVEEQKKRNEINRVKEQKK